MGRHQRLRARHEAPARGAGGTLRLSDRWHSALPLTALLAACGSAPRTAPSPAEGVSLALPPASFGRRLSLQQRVEVILPDRTIAFDAALDIAPDTLTLVALALNQRMLTLTYDGRTLSEQRSPQLPAEVRGPAILSDLQLALWPANAVRAALPSGWSLADSAQQRTLSHGSKATTVIRYTDDPRWQGRITITSTVREYRLVIQSVNAVP